MFIAIVCFQDCDVIHFNINLVFLVMPFFTRPKSQDKNLNILRTKRALKIKDIFIVLKGMPIKNDEKRRYFLKLFSNLRIYCPLIHLSV